MLGLRLPSPSVDWPLPVRGGTDLGLVLGPGWPAKLRQRWSPGNPIMFGQPSPGVVGLTGSGIASRVMRTRVRDATEAAAGDAGDVQLSGGCGYAKDLLCDNAHSHTRLG